MAPRDNGRKQVVIIGGGFTGASVALHLATFWNAGHGLDMTIFEPRTMLGGGLAYDTSEPGHRINVPADRMSLYPDDPEHFARWIERYNATDDDPDARTAHGSLCPRRAVFGRYVAAEMAPWIARGAVQHVTQPVVLVERVGGRWQVGAANGASVLADVVVIATTHQPPALPAALCPVAAHPGLIADALTGDGVARIGPDDRVLVVGNGLTAADVIASLDGRGHRGTIMAVSRRGLRSRGHPPVAQEPFGDFLTPPPRSPAELLVRVRRAIRQARAQGIAWQSVIDAVRKQGQGLWRHFTLVQRRQIVRHLRPYWDVHRFRVAPQVEAVLDRALAGGRLSIRAAGLAAAAAAPDGAIHITLAPRRGSGPEIVEVDKVVVATGPANGSILQSQAWIAKLADAGHLRPCATGLGIACDRMSRAIGPKGVGQPDLLVAGPLARGTFGELMGLPQLSDHARGVAHDIARLVDTMKTARVVSAFTIPQPRLDAVLWRKHI